MCKKRNAMIISNFQVHHILKAYSQQLADGSRVSKAKTSKNASQKDEVSISSESKKRLLTDKITQEIMSQFKNGEELSQTGRRILNQLSLEYGQPLEIAYNDEQGVVFSIPDPTDGQARKALSTPENEHLRKRLFDITQSTIYNDLV